MPGEEKELRLCQQILQENSIDNEDTIDYGTAIHTIEREELVLRQDLLRLVRWTAGSHHQTLSEAYAEALVSLTKEILPFGTDGEVWSSNRDLIDQREFAKALTQRYEVEQDVENDKR